MKISDISTILLTTDITLAIKYTWHLLRWICYMSIKGKGAKINYIKKSFEYRQNKTIICISYENQSQNTGRNFLLISYQNEVVKIHITGQWAAQRYIQWHEVGLESRKEVPFPKWGAAQPASCISKLRFLWFTRTHSAIIQLILPTICCSLGDIRWHIFSKLPIKYIINLSKSMHSHAIHHWNTLWQISLDIFSADQSSLDAWNVLISMRTVGVSYGVLETRQKCLIIKQAERNSIEATLTLDITVTKRHF